MGLDKLVYSTCTRELGYHLLYSKSWYVDIFSIKLEYIVVTYFANIEYIVNSYDLQYNVYNHSMLLILQCSVHNHDYVFQSGEGAWDTVDHHLFSHPDCPITHAAAHSSPVHTQGCAWWPLPLPECQCSQFQSTVWTHHAAFHWTG